MQVGRDEEEGERRAAYSSSADTVILSFRDGCGSFGGVDELEFVFGLRVAGLLTGRQVVDGLSRRHRDLLSAESGAERGGDGRVKKGT